MLFLQEVLDVRVWTVGNPAAASMLWRSTTQMEITGGMDLLSHLPNSHCAPTPQTQEWWEARSMCVDTTKEQVMTEYPYPMNEKVFERCFKVTVLLCFLITFRSP